jgi:uncharacterized membrane protein YjgN (DUF898 family)
MVGRVGGARMEMFDEGNRVSFAGHWREYLPIVASNTLLTLVTLGFYRFWATARTRRYLWSRTLLLGEPLEWTGSGRELFKGFAFAMLITALPFFIVQYGFSILLAAGFPVTGAILNALAFAAILYLGGVARFRALRYRLARTLWRGIHGGSADRGFSHGLAYLWRTVLGYVTLGLLVPWSMMSLWNRQINRMSFGSARFDGTGGARPIFVCFLPYYAIPFLLLAVFYVIYASYSFALPTTIPHAQIFLYNDLPIWVRLAAVTIVLLGCAILIGLITFVYRAAFTKEAIEHLTLDDLSFGFDADTDDWLRLFLGDAALLAITLGLGYGFIAYRHWHFYARHMRVHGNVAAERLTQSSLAAPGQGEGLADAFDVGAF